MSIESIHPFAVITGASSGIGFELAKQFVRHHFETLIVAEDPGIHAAADTLRGATRLSVTPVQLDLASYDAVEQLAAIIADTRRPLEGDRAQRRRRGRGRGRSQTRAPRHDRAGAGRELRDTGVSVTSLQPGPTDTNFFHRAGMDQILVGREGKLQNDPPRWGARASKRS